MSDNATTSLLRGICVNFVNFGGVEVSEIRSRDWASAAFAGVRHQLTLDLSGDGAEAAADAFLEDLEDKEFDLRGHILADICLVARENVDGRLRLKLEALTIEDA